MAKYMLSKFDEFKMKYYPIIIPVVTILLLGFILGYCFVNGGDKPTVTCEEVTQKLIELGYEPVDATYHYEDDIPLLKKCIYAEKEDVAIAFFEFDTASSVLSFHSNYNSQISKQKKNDWEGYNDNYSRYSVLSYDNIYYDCVLVGNTVVCAQSNYENKEEIFKFITSIKYNASTKENKEE